MSCLIILNINNKNISPNNGGQYSIVSTGTVRFRSGQFQRVSTKKGLKFP